MLPGKQLWVINSAIKHIFIRFRLITPFCTWYSCNEHVFLYRYVPEDSRVADDFQQLVSGVVWLVRDGKNYVDVSLKTESSETQETGA